MNKPILIASTSQDESKYTPVKTILEENGYPVIVYKTDKVILGEDAYTIDINEEGALRITYNGIPIGPEDISAAWHGKISSFDLPYEEPEIAKRLYIHNEIRTLHKTTWTLYPEDVWLSSPRRLGRAEHKLNQLIVARRVGFLIPHTLVSSSWEDVSNSLLPDDTSQMVIKMTCGVVSDRDTLKAVFANVANRSKIEKLKQAAYAFPGIHQAYVPKSREWRVTVVGNTVFSTAIYTDNTAKDDWRRLQATDAVQFKAENAPKNIDRLCIRYTQQMGLRYGAFDLVERPDGKVIFLECNPSGEYAGFEQKLGLSISQAIANQLMKIAQERQGRSNANKASLQSARTTEPVYG